MGTRSSEDARRPLFLSRQMCCLQLLWKCRGAAAHRDNLQLHPRGLAPREDHHAVVVRVVHDGSVRVLPKEGRHRAVALSGPRARVPPCGGAARKKQFRRACRASPSAGVPPASTGRALERGARAEGRPCLRRGVDHRVPRGRVRRLVAAALERVVQARPVPHCARAAGEDERPKIEFNSCSGVSVDEARRMQRRSRRAPSCAIVIPRL